MFDEKKEESLKVLEETTQKLGKSESLLGFIDERLKKLEEEKEDLKEYQKWDKTKRYARLRFLTDWLHSER